MRLVREVRAAALLALTAPASLAAQIGSIEGRVTDADGQPAARVTVLVVGTDARSETDDAGRFVLTRVPAGLRELRVLRLGLVPVTRVVEVPAAGTASVSIALAMAAIPVSGVIVSVTGEAQRLSRTAATVGVLGADAIRETRPTHPSELLGRIPGVWVNVTGGEGHMTAIRQPLTTNPVYLYLEDGVPTRSTGFFNHNALYEVNLPQAARVEVVKGPATALYGSDAIGGAVNVETRPATAAPGMTATAEAGAYGWARLLASQGFETDGGGVRADLNLTRTDGWRDGTAYDRQSATVRWDHALGASTVKAVAAFSHIDQQTAGSSRLPEDLYTSEPTRNLTPISFRQVSALRLSAEYEHHHGPQLVSVTPFFRHNSMDILPNWSLTYDPAIWETANRSIGVLAKYRRDFAPMDARLILGVDVDWSPGEHAEETITPVRDAGGAFTRYTPGAPIYDYGVSFLGVSPYLHAEASPIERLRMTAGLRFDRLGFEYENHLGPLDSGPHRRPASTSVSFTALSPKLGLVLDLGRGHSAFAAYGHGFRAPSEGQLFRQGVALNTVGLDPVHADNYEVGVRGIVSHWLRYEASAYHMRKRDDILSFQRPDDNTETQNAGETLHRGVELGLGARPLRDLLLDVAFSYGKHTYEVWSPGAGVDLGGHEMEDAPRTIGHATLTYTPSFVAGGAVALAWTHLGEYWLDAANSEQYAGHDVLDLRASVAVLEDLVVYAKVNNLTDTRYAENGGWSAFRGREFAPGLPRTLYAGIQLDLGGAR